MADDPGKPATPPRGRLPLVALAALGIVYGDIGTSPLYALRQMFTGEGHELAVSEANVLGLLSLVLWALVVVISVKYVAFVMRADNDGEGGTLALTALIRGSRRSRDDGRSPSRRRWALVLLGVFGTALLYGDGIITPAISVLSAVEGAEVATPALDRWVVPIAVAVLVALFAVQRRGTASLGRLFGPVMAVWFVVIGALGLRQVVAGPGVLRAVDPTYAVSFFLDNGFTGFLALGAVVLVVTGGEALYADMGHFGRRPIRLGWFTLVLPALLLNYFGQGALLLDDPSALSSPFYRLVPGWGVYPLVVLATLATVIASQALISGVFSLTMQAAQMGLTPHVRITHTSATAYGQIYVSSVNWALMAGCVALVVFFGSSDALGAAYGVAVTATMVITTALFYVVLRERFGWRRRSAGTLCALLGLVDLAFFSANVFKIPAGGWLPLVVATAVFTVMTTWRTGRDLLRARVRQRKVALDAFLGEVLARPEPPRRVPGTTVYLYATPGLAPPALVTGVEQSDVLPEHVVVVAVDTAPQPRVDPVDRADVTDLGHGVHQVALHYGYMERPDVPRGLGEGAAAAVGVPGDARYLVASADVVVGGGGGMATWRKRLFAVLTRNSAPATAYFRLPPARTVSVNAEVQL